MSDSRPVMIQLTDQWGNKHDFQLGSAQASGLRDYLGSCLGQLPARQTLSEDRIKKMMRATQLPLEGFANYHLKPFEIRALVLRVWEAAQ